MFFILKNLVIWPHIDTIMEHMPENYKKRLSKYYCYFLLYRTEIQKTKFSLPTMSVLFRLQVCNNFKRNSWCWSARCSDIFLYAFLRFYIRCRHYRREWFSWTVIKSYSMWKATELWVMTDKGFHIEKEIDALGLKLNIFHLLHHAQHRWRLLKWLKPSKLLNTEFILKVSLLASNNSKYYLGK